MELIIQNISKRFNKVWIFKNVSLSIPEGEIVAITGKNGSGKSTLVSIITGFMLPSLGKIVLRNNGAVIEEENIYKQFNVAAPYMELVEEFTLAELIDFHFKFVPIIVQESKESLISYALLEKEKNKQIKYFSSGMKQRLKLALAFFTDRPILIFDEPTVNLDNIGCQWYKTAINEKLKSRTLIISSNTPEEYTFATSHLNISDFHA